MMHRNPLLAAVAFLSIVPSRGIGIPADEADRLLQSTTATTVATTTTANHMDSVVCTNLKQRLYGTNNPRLLQEDPCQCQRLLDDTTGDASSSYYELQCRYDYCPACDPVTGLCAIRDETHTYWVSTYDAGSDASDVSVGANTTAALNDYSYVYVNATFCRIFVPPPSKDDNDIIGDDDQILGFDMDLPTVTTRTGNTSSATNTTTKAEQQLPPTFCVSNIHYSTTTADDNNNNNNNNNDDDSISIRNDYSCQIWIGGSQPTADNTCRSCSPELCGDSTVSSASARRRRMRTSYDCTNLPQGGKVSYCGLDAAVAASSMSGGDGVGSLLDQTTDLDLDRSSSFAAALYNYNSCERQVDDVEADNTDDNMDTTTSNNDGVLVIDVDAGDDDDDDDDDDSDAESDATATDTSSNGRENETTPIPASFVVQSTTTSTKVQSISLSDNGSIIGLGLLSTTTQLFQDNTIFDTFVQVYQQETDESNGNGMNWTLDGLPLHLEQYEQRRTPLNNETTENTLSLRLTSTGETMVVGYQQQQPQQTSWDVHTRAYNGWPSVGDAPPMTIPANMNANNRYRVGQRLDVANNGRTVARVNRPLPGSIHTHQTIPMVEVWDLVKDNQHYYYPAGEQYYWQARANEYSTTDIEPNMTDVSLSADGLRYAAGGTGLAFAVVKEWRPRPNNGTRTTKERTSRNGKWVQIGSNITADDRTNHLGDGFGYRVSLSSDGSQLAVGGYNFARFYSWNATLGDWTQQGSEVEYPNRIQGELCVSSTGNVFAIGQDQFGANETTGLLSTFQWDDNKSDWSLIGVYYGLGPGDHFGSVCSVSGDGGIVAAAGSMESDSRLGGYVQVFPIDDELFSTTIDAPSSTPSSTPSVQPTQIFITRPPPTAAPTVPLPTRGVDAIAFSSDGSKIAIANWTLRQRPTLLSLMAEATINERNATDGSWNVISESSASALYIQTFDPEQYTLSLDMTPDASVVMFDSYFDLLVYDTTGPQFSGNGEEIFWFSDFSRTVLSDNGLAVASVNIRDSPIGQPKADIIVHDYLWNSEQNASAWVQRGGVQSYWNAATNRSGIALSADGSTMAFASGLSSVRVITWNNDDSSWNQIGQPISIADSDDGRSTTFGAEVLLSADADKLAVSSQTHARIYYFNDTRWVQKGTDINFPDGVEGVLCGSPDSDIFAIGQPFFGASETGRVTVYRFEETDWELVGFVDGISPGDNFGHVCAVSADGSIVAAPGNMITESRVRESVSVFSVDSFAASLPREKETVQTAPPSEVSMEAAVSDADNSSGQSTSPTSSPTYGPQTNATIETEDETNLEVDIEEEALPEIIKEESSGGKLEQIGGLLETFLVAVLYITW